MEPSTADRAALHAAQALLIRLTVQPPLQQPPGGLVRLLGHKAGELGEGGGLRLGLCRAWSAPSTAALSALKSVRSTLSEASHWLNP